MPTTIAVSGAGGQLGRMIAEHLARREGPIIATSRSPERVTLDGAQVRRADFDDPATLTDAWTGADVLVLVPTDAPGEQRRGQHATALGAAAQSGVEHVVYPGLLAHGAPPTLADDHLATEALLRASGLAWTVLRNGIYADGLVDRALAEGALTFGGGAGRVAWAARSDLAEAAALVASDAASHPAKTLELTGPQALSLTEVGTAVAAATGRSLPVTALDSDTFAGGLAAAGLSDGVVAAMRGTARAIEQGRLDRVTDDLRQVLGRAPRTIGELAAEQASVT